MTVSIYQLPSILQALPERPDERPSIDPRYPCLQRTQQAPPALIHRLIEWCQQLPGVSVAHTALSIPEGKALNLAEDLAKGQPEAFIVDREFAIIRPEGSIHLALPPAWGQAVIDAGWATIHPLVRLLAGALPPQSLIVYAPRTAEEMPITQRILEATHGFAVGKIDGHILPDTAW